jgi:hypothetical protein
VNTISSSRRKNKRGWKRRDWTDWRVGHPVWHITDHQRIPALIEMMYRELLQRPLARRHPSEGDIPLVSITTPILEASTRPLHRLMCLSIPLQPVCRKLPATYSPGSTLNTPTRPEAMLNSSSTMRSTQTPNPPTPWIPWSTLQG